MWNEKSLFILVNQFYPLHEISSRWNKLKEFQRYLWKSDETSWNFVHNLKTCFIKSFVLHTYGRSTLFQIGITPCMVYWGRGHMQSLTFTKFDIWVCILTLSMITENYIWNRNFCGSGHKQRSMYTKLDIKLVHLL